MIHRLLVPCVCFFLLPLTVHASELQRIGTVIEVEGQARVISAQDTLAAKFDVPLYLHNVIETGDDSKAMIQLVDGTEFVLGEKARLKLDEYVYAPDNEEENKASYSVLRGAFLYTSGLVARKDTQNVTVATPYASVGIRGTQFWGGFIDGNYGVLVNDGRIRVTSAGGSVDLEQGQGTSLTDRKSSPGKVESWPADKIQRAVATITLKDPELIEKRILERKDKNIELLKQRSKARTP